MPVHVNQNPVRISCRISPLEGGGELKDLGGGGGSSLGARGKK